MEKIEQALAKFKKAKRIAVENFTSGGHAKWDMAAAMNLDMDARLYSWNSDTIKAIKFVMQGN